VTLVDLAKESPWNLPLGMVKAFKDICNLLFRCCNARSIMVGTAKMFMFAWKAVSPFLEEVQR
jgi:hypothetical protein